MREVLGFDTLSLKVREFREEDREALYELTRQPEITDLLPDWKMSEERLRDFLAFVIGSYATFDPNDVRVLLAIEHRTDGKLIGWIGVFPNDMLPPEEREVAYAISKDYRNRGYAAEATAAMCAYVFERSSLERIVAIVKTFNVASRRTAEKAGFARIRTQKLSDGADYDYLERYRD